MQPDQSKKLAEVTYKNSTTLSRLYRIIRWAYYDTLYNHAYGYYHLSSLPSIFSPSRLYFLFSGQLRFWYNALTDVPRIGDLARDGLHAAARNNDWLAVQAFLNIPGTDINARDNQGNTPLHAALEAAEVNSAQILNLLIDTYRANINLPNNDGMQPLHLLLMHHNSLLAAEFINRGAEINRPDRRGMRPMHFPAMPFEALRTLVENGIQLTEQNAYGYGPLYYALANLDQTGSTQINSSLTPRISLFLEHALRYNVGLYEIATINYESHLINTLLASLRNLYAQEPSQSYNIELILAAAQGNENAVAQLLNSYHDEINIQSLCQALIGAAFSGHQAILKILYQFIFEFHFDSLTDTLQKALLIAVTRGHKEIVNFILESCFSLRLNIDFENIMIIAQELLEHAPQKRPSWDRDIDNDTYAEIIKILREYKLKWHSSPTALYRFIQGRLHLESSLQEENDKLEEKNLLDQLQEIMEAQHSQESTERMALKILTQHTAQEPNLYPEVNPLVAHTERELDVLMGPDGEYSRMSLFQTINCTQTVAGAMTLRRYLAQKRSLKAVKEHQNLTKLLLKNKDQLHTLYNLLEICSRNENYFVSFWRRAEPGGCCDDYLGFDVEQRAKNIPSFLRESPTACGALEFCFAAYQAASPLLEFSVVVKRLFNLYWGVPYDFWNTHQDLSSLYSLYGTNNTCTSLKLNQKLHELMQEKLMSLIKLIEAVEAIAAYLETIDFPQDFINRLQLPRDTELKKLLDMLKTDTFRGKASFFSHLGRIQVAYRLMERYRDYFLGSYAALGEIDVLLSTVTLLENPTTYGRYCFAEFDENQEQPCLDLVNAWCPLLLNQEGMSLDKIVSNTIRMGTSQDSPRTLLITGANARGKTTMLRTAFATAHVAGVLSIAPAERCLLSPLTIISSINIADTIAGGQSHFQAEVHRAGMIMDAINTPGFYLLLIDEPLIGTAENIAQAAVREYLVQLGTAPNTLVLATSHIRSVTELEEEYPAFFANYYVSGYRLVRGTDYTQENYQSIALTLLKQATNRRFKKLVAKRVRENTKKNILLNLENGATRLNDSLLDAVRLRDNDLTEEILARYTAESVNTDQDTHITFNQAVALAIIQRENYLIKLLIKAMDRLFIPASQNTLNEILFKAVESGSMILVERILERVFDYNLPIDLHRSMEFLIQRVRDTTLGEEARNHSRALLRRLWQATQALRARRVFSAHFSDDLRSQLPTDTLPDNAFNGIARFFYGSLQ